MNGPPKSARAAAIAAAVESAVRNERAACIDHLRQVIAATQELERRGRVTGHEASQLVRRLDAIADAIGQGLHLGDGVAELRRGGVL